ncbi:hypothetical protein I5080_09925 [Salmonella enterica]|nr:hypothetical protein I5080_09925 [Salmonella enterica]
MSVSRKCSKNYRNPANQKPHQNSSRLKKALNAVKVHLGELYEDYSIRLTDMKPEYLTA